VEASETRWLGRREVGGAVHLITLRPSPEQARAYRAPGQYVRVDADSGGYFVLAGEVGAPTWELLVRANGGASDALIAAREGATFRVAGPFGDGFPLARAENHVLVLAVVGGALGAVRPLLHMRDPLQTQLYLGVRTASDVPIADEVSAFARAGGTVVLCVSSEDDRTVLPELRRAEGWVQHVLPREAPRGAIVFAAGPETMLEALRAMPELEVVTNA
jgi:dihydroorotate dehydrogenase electron transfer subunit